MMQMRHWLIAAGAAMLPAPGTWPETPWPPGIGEYQSFMPAEEARRGPIRRAACATAN